MYQMLSCFKDYEVKVGARFNKFISVNYVFIKTSSTLIVALKIFIARKVSLGTPQINGITERFNQQYCAKLEPGIKIMV